MSRFVRFAITAGVVAMLALAAPFAGADQQPAPDDGLRRGELVLVAGTGEDGYSGDGWDARKARMGLDIGLTVAPNGLLYIADRYHSRVRVVTADGKINTVPGTPAQGADDRYPPHATAIGPDGALYVATLGAVERWRPDGTVTVIAGEGDESFDDGGTGGDGGPATAASISLLRDIVVDAAGSIYVADSHDSRIRKITPDGTITTVAGGGTRTPAQAEGGPATQLTLTDPKGLVAPASLVADSAGNLYFALSEGSLVGKVTPDGTFHTVAGGDGGPIQAQVGGRLGGLAIDRADNLYVSDATEGLIRMITPDGTISTVGPATGDRDIAVGADGDLYMAGQAAVHRFVRHGEPAEEERQPVRRASPWAGRAPGTVVTVAGTGDVPAPHDTTVPTQFGHKPGPSHIAVGPDGTVYYADPGRNHVGTVAEDGRTTPIAGTGDGSGADQGPALQATLREPGGVAVGPDGTVYIAERGQHRTRKVTPDGNITTVADIHAEGVAVDAAGNLVVSDFSQIQRIDAAGTVSTLAGGGDLWDEDAEGKPALEARFMEPAAVTVAADGTVYFVEAYRATVRAVGVDGILRTVAGNGGYHRDGGFAGDGGPATAAILNNPGGLAVGPDGALYIADTFNHRIRRVGPDGVITTFAGTGEPAETGDGGPAATAALLEPTGLAFDRAGNLYLADPSGGSIRRIDTAGKITTIARFGGRASDDRKATETPLDTPGGIAVDRAGTLYVSAGATYAVGRDGTLDPVDGVGSGTLATGPDGSLYVSDYTTLNRRYPDDAIIGLVGNGSVKPPFQHGQLAITAELLGVTDVAVDPDGMVYLADGHNVYRIDRDGVITTVVRRGATGIAVGPDGSLYLANSESDRVWRFARGKLTRFAGTGLGYALDGDDGEGGPATEAVVSSPNDVEVAPDGTAYLSTPDGIRRVSRDGTINTILPAQHPDRPADSDPPGDLALDPHGNLYFTEQDSHRVRLLVRPGEIVTEPFGWRTMWSGLNIAVAVWVGVVVVIAYRRRLLELLTEWRDTRHPPRGWLMDR